MKRVIHCNTQTSKFIYEVDIYDEDGDYERTKQFDDYKTARKWIEQYNEDCFSHGEACAVPANFDLY